MESIVEKKPNFFRNAFNKTRYFLSKPYNLILVIFALFLTATVVLPLFSLLRSAFVIHIGGESREYGLPVGTFTFVHWRQTLFNFEYNYSYNFFYKPLINSVLMAILACVIAVGFGGVVAFLITRTNVPFKKFISLLFIFPYIMPTWSLAMFWENIFKNSTLTSAFNQVGFLEAVTGICVPEWMVYGLFPMSMCLGIHYAPFAYIFIGGILRNMDANLEEAGTILKASKFKVFRKITFPIILPGVMSTVLLVFASSMSSYTVPIFLNKHGKFPTVSTTMRALINGPTTKGMGFVVTTIIILISIAILSVNSHMTGKRKSFTTVTGKSGQVSKINLKKAKYPIAVLLAITVSFFAIMPIIIFGLGSLLRIPGNFSTFTTYFWTTTDTIETRIPGSSAGIFKNPTIWTAFGRTILLSVLVALIVGTFGILIGYGVTRKRGTKLSAYVSNLSFFPYLIPALSFGAIYFSLSFIRGFSWLNGTFFLLLLVGGVKFLPFATRSGTNAMMQLSAEIEEAATIVGVPWGRRMRKILFPIQKSSFISGYLLPFISCMREMSLFVLIGSSTSIITIVLQNFDNSGVEQIANGINFMLILFIITVNLIINKVTGASVDKGVGG